MTLSLAFESSLDKAIMNFLREDTIDSRDGKDLYKCEKCNKSSKAKIKTELSKLPSILVFHIKRFQAHTMKKIADRVKYTSKLDLDQ